MSEPPADGNISRAPEQLVEQVCLVVILALCTAPYFLRLGLYNDDWAFISAFRELAHYKDWTDPHIQILRLFYIRPLHGVWTYLLAKSFGLHPLPYHIVNMVILTISILSGYRLLRYFPITRSRAFAIAAIYCLLPELSTVKIWFASYCVTLSQMFFLIGANATLRWIDTGRRRWKLCAVLCWIGSILTYELFIPLIAAVGAFAVWKRAVQGRRSRHEMLRRAVPEMVDIALVLVSLAAKAFLTDRIEGAGPRKIVQMFIARWYNPLEHYGLNAKYALIVNFWETFRKPLGSVKNVVREPDSLARLACAITIAVLIYAISVRRATERPRHGLQLIGLGFVLFWLGYAIFFLTLQTGLTSAGVANRTAVAAGFGVAVVAVGAAICAARLVPVRMRGHLVAGMLGFMGFALALRSSQVDYYWADAYRRQQDFLQQSQVDLAGLAPNSTIMVEGLCRYSGPASVFETWWDTSGALKILLGKDIVADMVSRYMSIMPRGIHTTIYGRDSFYEYGGTLYVYETRRRRLVPLPDRSAADRVLGPVLSAPQVDGCPRGYFGHGVPI